MKTIPSGQINCDHIQLATISKWIHMPEHPIKKSQTRDDHTTYHIQFTIIWNDSPSPNCAHNPDSFPLAIHSKRSRSANMIINEFLFPNCNYCSLFQLDFFFTTDMIRGNESFTHIGHLGVSLVIAATGHMYPSPWQVYKRQESKVYGVWNHLCLIWGCP